MVVLSNSGFGWELFNNYLLNYLFNTWLYNKPVDYITKYKMNTEIAICI